MKEKHITTTI